MGTGAGYEVRDGDVAGLETWGLAYAEVEIDECDCDIK